MSEEKSLDDLKVFLAKILKDIPKEHHKEHLNDLKNLYEDIEELKTKGNLYTNLEEEQNKLKKDYKELIDIFKETINFQTELSRHLVVSNQMRLNLRDWDRFPLLYTSYLKNITTYVAVLELIEKNLWGPARMLIRNLFESLLLSKYCFITENQNLFEKWDNGEHINITYEVINKIQDNDEIRELKNTLNKYTHFSVYSNQGSLEYDSTQSQLTFFFLYLMLQMNFTMYHRYLINNNSLKDSIIRYLGYRKVFLYSNVYDNTKSNLKELKKRFIKTNKSKRLFRELEKKWIIN